MPNLKISKKHQLSVNAKSQDVQPVLTYKKANSSNSKNGRNFNIHSSITCESSNLIYVITCSGCGEHYIGQTGDTLRHRMTVHRQQIRETKYQCTAVSGHLRNCAKNIIPNFTVCPIYKFYKTTTEKERETKEKHFISLHKPQLNAL